MDPRRWTLTLALLVATAAPLAGPVGGQAPGRAGKSALPSVAAAPRIDAQSRPLDVGSVVSGSLDAGDPLWPESRFYDTYELAGRARSTVTVDVRSDDFDAVLYLIGSFELTFDDDGGNGCDARIQITFPVDGTYTLIASSYHRDERGAYTLSVTDRPPAPRDQTCGRASAAPDATTPPPNETCVALQWMEWLSIAAAAGGGSDYPLLEARDRTACELGLETPSGDRWPSGQVARQFDNWYYPNGQVARQFDNWYYPNGQVARQFDNWHYSQRPDCPPIRQLVPPGRHALLGSRHHRIRARAAPRRPR